MGTKHFEIDYDYSGDWKWVEEPRHSEKKNTHTHVSDAERYTLIPMIMACVPFVVLR